MKLEVYCQMNRDSPVNTGSVSVNLVLICTILAILAFSNSISTVIVLRIQFSVKFELSILQFTVFGESNQRIFKSLTYLTIPRVFSLGDWHTLNFLRTGFK